MVEVRDYKERETKEAIHGLVSHRSTLIKQAREIKAR